MFHTKIGKNQVFFSQKDFYQAANKIQLQASHKFGMFAFLKAFVFGSVVSIFCIDKFMNRYEIVKKAEKSLEHSRYDPNVYHPENKIRCSSKPQDFFIPSFIIQTLYWYRRLGPVKSVARSLVLSSLYTIPFQCLNLIELLPWQIARRVYIEAI